MLKQAKDKRLLELVVELHTTKTKVVDEALELFKNRIKDLYSKRETSFQLKESKSALREFASQYRIDEKDSIDTNLFLDNAKQSRTNIIIVRRHTEVKLILSCTMEKVNPKSGEVIVKEVAFHFKTDVNLESTDLLQLAELCLVIEN